MKLLRWCVLLVFGATFAASAAAEPALRVGVTLHPYYSWVANVVEGTGITVVPVIDGNVDIDAYQPRAEDIARIASLDVLIVNGLGHDAVVDGMVKAAKKPSLLVVNVNRETPTLPEAQGQGANSHTFLSLTNAVAQSALIARELGARVEPAVAVRLQDNAARYAKRLRAMLAATKQRLKPLARPRVVTVHDGYGYLLQELGVGLAGVVEPAHGLLPAAGELQRIVELVKREHIVVVLAEASFPQALQRPLVDVGARVSVISHVATGAFAADTFERGMQANLDTLVEALGAP